MTTSTRSGRPLPVAMLGWLLIAAAAGIATLAVFLIFVSPREWTAWAALAGSTLAAAGGGRLAFGR